MNTQLLLICLLLLSVGGSAQQVRRKCRKDGQPPILAESGEEGAGWKYYKCDAKGYMIEDREKEAEAWAQYQKFEKRRLELREGLTTHVLTDEEMLEVMEIGQIVLLDHSDDVFVDDYLHNKFEAAIRQQFELRIAAKVKP